jgi:translation initiation factor IF-1
MKNTLYWPALVSTTVIAGALLVGCASNSKEPAAAPTPPPPVVQQDRPGKGQADLITVTATVTAIDKKNRIVTLKFEDGHESNIKCGPEVRNFAQIRKGDVVKTQFLESVELFIADSPEEPAADRTKKLARAPKGAKPGVAAVDSVEVRATVAAINYETREVTLQGPEGGLKKIKVGPEVKRLAEVKQGDTVVARLTRAFSITVSTPAKK